MGRLIIQADSNPWMPDGVVCQRMQTALDAGTEVIWDYRGLQRRLPAPVIRNLLELREDHGRRRPGATGLPHALLLWWNQTEAL